MTSGRARTWKKRNPC